MAGIHPFYFTAHTWKYCVITEKIWDKATQLIDAHETETWSKLLLDAEELLPDIGASIVMAAAALEVLIEVALSCLASINEMPKGLWEWINNRGDYRKEPSEEEKYDNLLYILANKSLKAEQPLWEAFKNIKSARNSFLHEGKLVIGKEDLTIEKSIMLISKAKEIAVWIEQLLPIEKRAPILEDTMQVQLSKRIR